MNDQKCQFDFDRRRMLRTACVRK